MYMLRCLASLDMTYMTFWAAPLWLNLFQHPRVYPPYVKFIEKDDLFSLADLLIGLSQVQLIYDFLHGVVSPSFPKGLSLKKVVTPSEARGFSINLFRCLAVPSLRSGYGST